MGTQTSEHFVPSRALHSGGVGVRSGEPSNRRVKRSVDDRAETTQKQRREPSAAAAPI